MDIFIRSSMYLIYNRWICNGSLYEIDPKHIIIDLYYSIFYTLYNSI